MPKILRGEFDHKIKHDPEPEDAGTIKFRVKVRFLGKDDDNLTFTTLSFADEFINDDHNECQSKVDLNRFLKEAGTSDDDIAYAMSHFIPFVVAKITSSTSDEYSPGCALEVSFDILLLGEPCIGEAVKVLLDYEIKHDPEPEKEGTIRVYARIFFGGEDYLAFTTLSLAGEFIIDDRNECRSKVDLNNFFKEAGISDHDIAHAMRQLIPYVAQITSSTSNGYSPGCALEVWFALFTHDEPHNEEAVQVEELVQIQEEVQVEEAAQIEEAVQISFDETTNICLRPASKVVVKSLTRKIYEKISSTGQKCTICLEEFNDGRRVVTLPCGHDFDDECVLKWFETNHDCPLCRFKLPCEDQ